MPGNRLLKTTYDTESEEETGGWRRVLVKELHNLYTSAYVTAVIEIDGAHERGDKRLHSYGSRI
jgi:hypothetical protein